MVTGVTSEERYYVNNNDEDMEMENVRERSRSLQNFSTLPCFTVKWGRQMKLRCVKDASDYENHPTSSSSPNHQRHRDDVILPKKRRSVGPPVLDVDDGEDDGDGGIASMREKLMSEIRTEVHQMKAAILTNGSGNGNNGGAAVSGGEAVVGAAEQRPWNLRTRRAVCKDPHNNGNTNDRKLSLPTEVKSPPRREKGIAFGIGSGSGTGTGTGPRAKFTATLSKQEVEEDFLAMVGTRPARRPKRRPKYVQKTIDGLFPGYWLSEITADMYKVNENPEGGNGKR